MSHTPHEFGRGISQPGRCPAPAETGKRPFRQALRQLSRGEPRNSPRRNQCRTPVAEAAETQMRRERMALKDESSRNML